MKHVQSVQHVKVVADQNVIVHGAAFSCKKNVCYVLLVNEILVIEKKRKSMPI